MQPSKSTSDVIFFSAPFGSNVINRLALHNDIFGLWSTEHQRRYTGTKYRIQKDSLLLVLVY